MKRRPIFESLQLKAPVSRTFCLVIVLIVGILAGGELALRWLVSRSLIRPPLIGSQNAEMDIKLSMLDALSMRESKIDCIFIGSSQFDAAINPEIFTQQYQAISGRKITCYNFSIATLTASPAGKIANILARRYHPRLLVYGTSARDYSTDFGEWARPLLEDAWVRYQSGSFNLRGWLVDNFYVVRILIGFGKTLDPDYDQFQSRLAVSLSRFGYLAGDGNNLDNPKDNFIPHYERSAQDMAGLDDVLRLKSHDVQVIILEVPVHESFLLHYVEASPEAYQTLFVAPLSEFVGQRDIPFWRTMGIHPPLIPDAGWGDVKHLNDTGARILSAWFGEKLAGAIASKEIKDPFH